ncbi:hypothetical protein PAHAL_2G332700 [Panicum hallii]|uniref:Uncharacterized protein n=1 Tax=Panicum hallii TaxID=206008 RepID=A0A2S3GZZ4_9POAL|nr:hypothetical protein PAHAL_2G332700 [Panicum hallii]
MAVLLLLWLAALLASSSASAPGFDYFVLALQWPGTVCRSSAADGLWPSYAHGNGPTCCNNPDFDMAKISNLTMEFQKYWPSLYCSTPSLCSGGHGSLWAHEVTD